MHVPDVFEQDVNTAHVPFSKMTMHGGGHSVGKGLRHWGNLIVGDDMPGRGSTERVEQRVRGEIGVVASRSIGDRMGPSETAEGPGGMAKHSLALEGGVAGRSQATDSDGGR
jgi:hypothetical protein